MGDFMKYRIGNQIYKIDLDSLKVIGRGTEGCIYEYDGEALKIFNKIRLKYGYAISEEKINLLSTITVDRMILPDNIIYQQSNNNYKFVGHTMKLLKNNLPLSHLFARGISEVLEDIKLLESDIAVLSDYGIKMYDYMHNFYYNGNLYLIDSSYYTECKNLNEAYIHNKESINTFFIYNLLLKPTSNNLNLNRVPINSGILLNCFDSSKNLKNINFSRFLKELSYEHDINTISDIQKKYVKKIIKDFTK